MHKHLRYGFLTPLIMWCRKHTCEVIVTWLAKNSETYYKIKFLKGGFNGC